VSIGSYKVTLCGRCVHPGGQHWASDGRFDPSDGCHLCDCPGFTEGGPGQWDDAMTAALRHARRSTLGGKTWPVRVTDQ
jgi:hypothetical protein